MLKTVRLTAAKFVAALVLSACPMPAGTPAPFDLRRRYWPPHRRVGTPCRARNGSYRRKLVGAKGLRP